MNFSVIAITLPQPIANESGIISELLASGCIDRVHLRKPESTPENMQKLIEDIPSDMHSLLSLHDFHYLAPIYGCGVHLNSRNPQPPENYCGIMSCSCHSVRELELQKEVSYKFLSPIYPSISKPGYHPESPIASLKRQIADNTIALGGVTPDKFRELSELGFSGGAMLGYIWKAISENRLYQLIKEIKCYNS
ncbi:MAG: thiamine phosphate synthase [Muribaculaceae bacterium]|nr:thiamine phosphate synthase [Muribaculaceae bacterium]